MSDTPISDTVEQLAERCVMIDHEDLQGLAQLLGLFDHLLEQQATLPPRLGILTAQARAATLRLILRETLDSVKAFEILGESIATLQRACGASEDISTGDAKRHAEALDSCGALDHSLDFGETSPVPETPSSDSTDAAELLPESSEAETTGASAPQAELLPPDPEPISESMQELVSHPVSDPVSDPQPGYAAESPIAPANPPIFEGSPTHAEELLAEVLASAQSSPCPPDTSPTPFDSDGEATYLENEGERPRFRTLCELLNALNANPSEGSESPDLAEIDDLLDQLLASAVVDNRPDLADVLSELVGRLHAQLPIEADAIVQLATWLENEERLFEGELSENESANALLGRLWGIVPIAPPAEQDLDTTDPEDQTPPALFPSEEFLIEHARSIQDFASEARDHLAAADSSLLELEGDPQQAESVDAVFRAFHTIKGIAGLVEMTPIQRLAHELENLLELSRQGDLLLVGPSIDVTFQGVDLLKSMLTAIDDSLKHCQICRAPENFYPVLRGIQAEVQQSMKGASRAGKSPLESRSAIQDDPNDDFFAPGASSSRANGSAGSAAASPASESASNSSAAAGRPNNNRRRNRTSLPQAVKVDAGRLDRLIETIGELVISVAMVQRENNGSEHSSLDRRLSQLERITRDLQEIGTSLRMVPLRSTFDNMARLARDVGRQLDKPVQLSMIGEDTELDKAVVDRIGDPLIHLIRNAVDHGIEPTPNERTQRGKPATGTVHLKAHHKGGGIYIEVGDDGRGLDRDTILKRAFELRLVDSAQNMTDREVFSLLFEPGFSTAHSVTEVSGRGVGLDVVRQSIESLRGTIDIQSTPGQGTTFIIRLPLTLAIIDGMLLRVGSERYILPTASIIRSIRPERDELTTILNRGEMLVHGEELIPLMRMGELFGIPDAETDATDAIVVIFEADAGIFGILVDELLGQQQIVIKSLGEGIHEVPGIAGGAIMPDGCVGLILDVDGLVRISQEHEGRTRNLAYQS